MHVHIKSTKNRQRPQTKNRRLEISKDDFVKYASLVLLAEKNLKHLKNAK